MYNLLKYLTRVLDQRKQSIDYIDLIQTNKYNPQNNEDYLKLYTPMHIVAIPTSFPPDRSTPIYNFLIDIL